MYQREREREREGGRRKEKEVNNFNFLLLYYAVPALLHNIIYVFFRYPLILLMKISSLHFFVKSISVLLESLKLLWQRRWDAMSRK